MAVILWYTATANALTGDARRFDWSLGTPAVTADNTNTCNGAATVRFDWSSGFPMIVYDATATCAAAVVVSVNVQTLVKVKGGLLKESRGLFKVKGNN